MADIEEALREVLRRRGEDVAPPPLTGSQLRRLRLRQGGVILLTAALIASLAVGSVIAVRAVRSVVGEPDGLVPAAAGPLARSVFVAEEFLAEEPWEPYASTIQVVRSGPDGPRVIRTFDALGAPDMALTPDGSRLYVLSGDGRPGDELVAFDVAAGEVEMTARLQPEGRLSRVSGWPIPCCPTMEVSPDGRWLFLLWVTGGDEGERTFFVATFDTVERAMFPEMMSLEECEPGIQALVPLPGARRLAVVCEQTTDVRFFEASETGGVASFSRLRLPEVSEPRTKQVFDGLLDVGHVAWALPSPDRSLLYAVTLNGHVSVVDLERRSLVGEHEVDLGPDRHVGYGQVHLSGNGESMFLGLGPMSDGFDLSTATEVMEVDTSTWAELRTVSTGTRFGAFAVTLGADEVYVASHPRGLLLVDMASGRISEVPGVGPGHEMLETAG